MLTDNVLSPAQQDRWHQVVARAQELLGPCDLDRDSFNVKGWLALGELGMLGLPVSPDYGGQGADPVTMALTVEALGYACSDNGLLFSAGAHLWSAVTPLHRFGSQEHKDRYLRGLVDGSLVGVQAMTEPGSGSDAFSMHTTAVVDGDEIVLNGSKTFITNAPVADVFVVFVTTDRSKGWAGLSAFVVDRETPGLGISNQIHKLGIDSSPFGELYFDNCRIPATSTISKLGAGMIIFTHSMDFERTYIVGPALGTMRRQIERCVALAPDCTASGRRLLAERVGAMTTRLHTTRLLFYRTAQRRAENRTKLPDAALMKLALSEAWVASCHDTIAAHALVGRGSEADLHRDLHDSLGSRIYSGTSQIQRDLVAQQLKLPAQ